MYPEELKAKQALSEEGGMVQKHPEAALKPDVSKCFGSKVRRPPNFPVSVVVCTSVSIIEVIDLLLLCLKSSIHYVHVLTSSSSSDTFHHPPLNHQDLQTLLLFSIS